MGEAKRRKMAGTYSSQPQHWIVPQDLREDIAKSVQAESFDCGSAALSGGFCFLRTKVASALFEVLGIPYRMAAGGLVYRVGPDERRDTLSFCGLGNAGCLHDGNYFLGHIWLESGDDIIDFSAGDWREQSRNYLVPAAYADGEKELGPIHWGIPNPPDFIWAPKASLQPEPGKLTPDLGRMWYTGWRGPLPSWERWCETFWQILSSARLIKHIKDCCKHFALRERVFAAREGHTAVRRSELNKLLGLPAPPDHDRLIVLRGKVNIDHSLAQEILAEAGLA